jgi:hypothetical protein
MNKFKKIRMMIIKNVKKITIEANDEPHPYVYFWLAK